MSGYHPWDLSDRLAEVRKGPLHSAVPLSQLSQQLFPTKLQT